MKQRKKINKVRTELMKLGWKRVSMFKKEDETFVAINNLTMVSMNTEVMLSLDPKIVAMAISFKLQEAMEKRYENIRN